jgi:hypothetical protein
MKVEGVSVAFKNKEHSILAKKLDITNHYDDYRLILDQKDVKGVNLLGK